MDPSPDQRLQLAAALVAAAVEATERELDIYALELRQSRARLARLQALQRQIGRLVATATAYAVTASDSART